MLWTEIKRNIQRDSNNGKEIVIKDKEDKFAYSKRSKWCGEWKKTYRMNRRDLRELDEDILVQKFSIRYFLAI